MIANNKLILEKENLVKNSTNTTINCISPMPPSSESEANEDESDATTISDGKLHHYVKKNEYRRVSVAAERYNPEDDDSDDEEYRFYPKTSEQRQRLKEAVCHSLLFRTLEVKQIDQILDAMWEQHVQQGECIIRQGIIRFDKFIF
ncbi:unnamed protein product [Rotaria socialis]|uniref:Cyclic nucleotide-binding domain-containing protein n=1 Tax=Rotaria socialis TaxID=392032 RepID=A0A820QFS4_9BILA|nr:unnamed protein product [Rotaria socialis]